MARSTVIRDEVRRSRSPFSLPLLSDPNPPLDQRWIPIPENVWHQAVTPSASWAVVSFHTVPAEELIEQRPDPDKPGSMHQSRYLEREHDLRL
jgi:hypothetical protein